MKFSGKSQESLNSPISLILLHSFPIRFSRALIRDPNLSFFFFNEADARMSGADVDEPRSFEGGKLSRFFGVGWVGDKEVELKTGWFDKMVLVEMDEGGRGGSQRRRRVKKEEKKIIGVKGLKIILAPSWLFEQQTTNLWKL